MLNILGS